jgi:hypothetical protein
MGHLAPAKWGRQMYRVFCAKVMDWMVCSNLCFGLKKDLPSTTRVIISIGKGSAATVIRTKNCFHLTYYFVFKINDLHIFFRTVCEVLLFTLSVPRRHIFPRRTNNLAKTEVHFMDCKMYLLENLFFF